MEEFKIRNSDGNYSSGGTHPFFRKTGKKWRSRRALSLHFAQFSTERKKEVYANCILEKTTYEVVDQSEEPLVV